MIISEVEEALRRLREEHGDIDVMITSSEGTFSLYDPTHRVAEADEFPEDWQMPEGFEWIDFPVLD